MLNLRTSILLLCALGVAACSPKRDERKFQDTRLTVTARTTDTKLKLPREATLTNADGVVSTARVLQAIDDLRTLGLTEQSVALSGAFYGSAQSTYPIKIKQSPYLSAAAGATYEDAKRAVDGFSTLLTSQEKLINEFLAANPLELPQKGMNSVAMIEAVEAHIQKIKDFVNSPAIHPIVRKEMLDELRREADLKLPPLREILQAIERSKTVGDVLKQVDDLVEAADEKLDEDSRKNIAFGQKLHRRIETVKDSADVLEAVVMIWEFLSPEEREQQLKPASKELYEFLHGQERATLDCMARRTACDVLDWGQKFFVEMKIDDNGIPKLQALARGAVRDGSLKIVRRNVRQALKNVPDKITEQVKKNFGKYSDMLGKVLPNYISLMETILTGWAKKDLGGMTKVHGFETRMTTFAEHGGVITLAPVAEDEKLADTRTLGVSLTTIANRLAVEKDELVARQGFFEVLNKLLAIGGYRDVKKNLVRALTVPFKPTISVEEPASPSEIEDEKLDIEKVASSTHFWAIPDVFIAGESVNEASLPKAASAESQAELLRGLAKTIPLLQDWKQTPYDAVLGAAQAGAYLPKEFEGANLALPLFPKAQMFALTVANSAVLLMNLKTGLSPAFLMGEGLTPKFLPEKTTGAGMAGVVDIVPSEKGPRRADVTTSIGISKTILALTEFLNATENLDKTEAKALTAKSDAPDAKSAVDVLKESREEMRVLVLALANMLNQKMASGQRGVDEAYSVSELKILADKPKRLIDQVYAIQAFLAAGKTLGSPMHAQFAVETYHFMNRELYRADTGFYAESNAPQAATPDWLTTAQALTAVRALLPTLEGESRQQAEALLALQGQALGQLRFGTAE